MLHPTIDDDWCIYVEFMSCIYKYVLIQIWILKAFLSCLFHSAMGMGASKKNFSSMFILRNRLHNNNNNNRKISCFMILLYRNSLVCFYLVLWGSKWASNSSQTSIPCQKFDCNIFKSYRNIVLCKSFIWNFEFSREETKSHNQLEVRISILKKNG